MTLKYKKCTQIVNIAILNNVKMIKSSSTTNKIVIKSVDKVKEMAWKWKPVLKDQEVVMGA